MVFLPNNCYCSELKVAPKNYKNSRSSIKKDWYVYYRFYDLKIQGPSGQAKGKLVVLKGMNIFKTREERRVEVDEIISRELKRLTSGFNPYNLAIIEDNTGREEVSPVSFITSLTNVSLTLKVSDSSKRDLKSILGFVERAAQALNLYNTPIKDVSRKHVKMILTEINTAMGESTHRYNKVRSYLMIIFKELVELELIESNPIKDISKMKGIQKIRKTLSIEKRRNIDEFLRTFHYRFWLFTHIFFHSGARLTEIMSVKIKDVNLETQEMLITINKGRTRKETVKPIKDIAIPFWREAIQNGNREDFAFSKGLVPGVESIQTYQITKRWSRLVKKKLGIVEDFYSLKHLNLDQVASELTIQDAAAMASHASTAITLKYYAVGEKSRQQLRLKKMSNEFA